MEIARDYYLKKLVSKRNNRLIKIITGVRRCGKSYLLDPLFTNYLRAAGVKADHIIKLDLEERQNRRYLDPDALDAYIRSLIVDDDPYYVILDEIQLVPDFEAVLNGFLHLLNVDVYVTGSNSRFLSSDIATEFRGRGDEIRLYPLSFSEFMSVYPGDETDGLNEYLLYGGLPLIANFATADDKIQYLSAQKDNVYINDVIERRKIKNDAELKTLIAIVASAVGSLTNPYKLYQSFNSAGNKDISGKTIAAYLKYLEESFLIEKAQRFDVKGKKYIATPAKYYFVDVGIRNSFLNFRQWEKNHLMENVVYLELRRRGFNVDVGVVEKRNVAENGKKDYKRLEIDFVANKGSAKYYLQSAYNVDDAKKRAQETRSLRSVDDNFKKIVVVYDRFAKWQDDNGIVYLSIYDFLLNENSLKEA